jgi:hypothetical protein
LLRFALAQDVHEDALDALLVEFVVLAEADQVAQQAFLVDLRAGRNGSARCPSPAGR